jgi:hypothetical protein
MQIQNVKLGTQMSNTRGSLACVLPVVCCVLFLACAAQSGIQQPVRPQAAPPPTDNQVVTPANSEGSEAPIVEQGRPRVMVVIKQVPNDDNIAVTDPMLEPETLENLLADAFRSRGFPVVSAATVREHLTKDQLRRILEGDDRTAAEVGLGVEADVVVGGTLQESSERHAAPNPADTTDVVKVKLEARAVNTATGEVLGSTLVELNARFSVDAARQQAADSAAAELSASILGGWQARTIITEIYAEDADDRRVQLLKSEILGEASGVDSVITRSLAGRTAVVEVFSRISSDELLAQMDRCTTVLPFTVTSFSGNRIDIRFLDQPEECQPELR